MGVFSALQRSAAHNRHGSFGLCKRFISSNQLTLVPTLDNISITAFRKDAFQPGLPYLFPRGHFSALPAVSKWFIKQPQQPNARFLSASYSDALNTTYFKPFDTTIVPLEATTINEHGEIDFASTEQPLAIFLALMDATQHHDQIISAVPKTNVYLAQCSLAQLPAELSADLPTPEHVLFTGRGDLYASSIWIGRAPTYTPLHKDPNPNLFVQLGGRKVVRIFSPPVGAEIFAEVPKMVSKGTSGESTSTRGQIRGEEMMVGEERRILEELVWGQQALGTAGAKLGQEVELDSGDGMFIPQGWWHSIKGVGQGIVGSVNWWFR